MAFFRRGEVTQRSSFCGMRPPPSKSRRKSCEKAGRSGIRQLSSMKRWETTGTRSGNEINDVDPSIRSSFISGLQVDVVIFDHRGLCKPSRNRSFSSFLELFNKHISRGAIGARASRYWSCWCVPTTAGLQLLLLTFGPQKSDD